MRILFGIILGLAALIPATAHGYGCGMGSMCHATCNDTQVCTFCWTQCCDDRAACLPDYCILEGQSQCFCAYGYETVWDWCFTADCASCEPESLPREQRPVAGGAFSPAVDATEVGILVHQLLESTPPETSDPVREARLSTASDSTSPPSVPDGSEGDDGASSKHVLAPHVEPREE